MKKHAMLYLFNFVTLLFVNAVSSTSNLTTTENYLWKDLVSLPSTIFEQAFLPSYIDFDAILQHKNDSNFTTNFTTKNSPSVSQACKSSLQAAISALRARQTWAVKLFSSWGRLPPAGLASGTLTDLGEYDQCRESILDKRFSIQDSKFTPQYCLLEAAFPMPPVPRHHNYFQPVLGLLPKTIDKLDNQNLSSVDNKLLQNSSHFNINNSAKTVYQTLQLHASVLYYVRLKVGICLPSTCSEVDIRQVAEKKIKLLGLRLKKISCESFGNKKSSSTVQTIAKTAIYCLLLITLTAAIFTQTRWKHIPSLTFLHWFSPLDNLGKLFSTNNSKEMSQLACIHGLRAITLLWIITAHTLEWTSLGVYRDTFLIRDRLASGRLQIIYKAFYAVETFFYLSGFLTAVVTLKYTGGQYSRFRYLEFLTLRWARLTPQLALFLLLTVGLIVPHFDGPLWPDYVRPLVVNCAQNWWLGLLYLQNWVKPDDICAVHTWYLAADMQLHFLSLLPIVCLLISWKLGQTAALIMACVCAAVSGVQVYSGRHPPGHIVTSKNDFLNEDGMPSNFVAFLYQPQNHGSVFFIGLLFGVYFYKNFLSKQARRRRVKVVISQFTKYQLWAAGTCSYLFCLYSTYPYVLGSPYYNYQNPHSAYNLLPAILFPLNRTLWALALTCAIQLCATGNGGHLNSLLTWSAFKPLSRASYALYLTHAWVVWVALGSRRSLIDLADGWSLTFHLTAVVFGSIFVGIAFNVLVETPFINALEQYKRRREKLIETEENKFTTAADKGQEIVLQDFERREVKVIISQSLIE